MRLVLALLPLAACDNGGATPDWSRMIDQPKQLPYEREMRPLPEGVIPRNWIVDPERRTGRTAAGTDIADVPVPITRELLERGRDRFDVTCAACHGHAGDGDTAVAHAMERRRPPSLHEARIRALAAGDVFRVITAGYGLMPSYAGLLDVDDRWAVVAYVRTLELSWTARLDALPEPVRERVTARLP